MALLAAHLGAGAATATLVAMQDASIFSGDGGASGIDFANRANGAGYSLFVGTNGTGSVRRALVRFDLATLPANAVVTAATLSLTLDRQPNDSNQALSVHVLTSPWTTGASNSDLAGTPGQGTTAQPGDATWLFASWPGAANPTGVSWLRPGGDFEATAISTTTVGPLGPNLSPLTYRWSGAGLVDSLNRWLRQPAGNFGWMVKGNETLAQSVKRFMSREAVDSTGASMDAALLPNLLVTYDVPPPVVVEPEQPSDGQGGTTPGGGDGGSSANPPTTPPKPPAPFGKVRRRLLLPKPVPCCW